MHQMILDILREVERNQDPTLSYGQVAEDAHPLRSLMLVAAPAQHMQNTTRLVVIQYTAKAPSVANRNSEGFWC
jgi:hypothetical protein